MPLGSDFSTSLWGWGNSHPELGKTHTEKETRTPTLKLKLTATRKLTSSRNFAVTLYRDDIDRSGRVVACMTAVWEDSGLNLTELVLPSGNSTQQYAVFVTHDIAHYGTTRCHPQIKPEAHNIFHCRENRIDPRPQVGLITCTENFAEFVCVVFDTREGTDRHTDMLIAIFRTSIWGEVIIVWLCCIAYEISLNL